MDCVNPAFKLFNWAVNKGPDADTEAEAPGHLRRVMSAKPFSKRPLNKSMNYNETPFNNNFNKYLLAVATRSFIWLCKLIEINKK